MKCLVCEGRTIVTTTYQNEDGRTKRRRECTLCGFRFTTREHPEAADVEIAETRLDPREDHPVSQSD